MGIGLELLYMLQAKGSNVLVVGLEDVNFDLENITYLKVDISSQKSVDYVFEYAKSLFNEIDIYIANAGFTYYESVEAESLDKTKNIFDVNVFSGIYAFNKLKNLKGSKPFHFAVTGSAMSYMPLAGYALYLSSKFVLKGYFDAARFELEKDQYISMTYPITTKTNFFKKDMPIPFPAHSANKVASSYLKGIKKQKRHIFPSKMFWLDTHFNLIQPLIQAREAKLLENG